MKRLDRLANHARDTQHENIPNVPTPAERYARIVAVMRDNGRYKERTPMTTNPLVPLGTAALELGTNADALARRLADQISIDEHTGLRMLPATVCRQLIAERAARQAAQREQSGRISAEQAQRTRALRDRVQAIARRDKTLRESGVLDPDAPALAVMATGDHQRRMDKAGARFDEMLAAGNSGHIGVIHSFRREEQ